MQSYTGMSSGFKREHFLLTSPQFSSIYYKQNNTYLKNDLPVKIEYDISMMEQLGKEPSILFKVPNDIALCK